MRDTVRLRLLDHQLPDDYQLGDAPARCPDVWSNLPDCSPDFVGREGFLDRVCAALQRGGVLITSDEPVPGIGKTECGLVVAHRLCAEGAFPDGVIFLDLDIKGGDGRQPKTAQEALQEALHLLLGLDVRLPPSLGELRQLWAEQTAGKKMLLFLDGAHDQIQLRPLMPLHESIRVIVTSRRRFALAGVLTMMNVFELSPSNGVALAMRLANRLEGGRLAPEEARQLVELASGNPLQIRLLASALAWSEQVNPTVFLGDLAARVRTIPPERRGGEVVRVCLDVLDPRVRRRWRHLSIFEDGFDASAAGAIWMCDDAKETLLELEQRGLVTVDRRDDRFRIHDPLLAIALEELENDEARLGSAQRRMAIHFLSVLRQADRLYGSDGLAGEGRALYFGERRNIAAAHGWAAMRLDDHWAAGLANSYTEAAVRLLEDCEGPQEQELWLEVQLAAQRRLGDRRAECQVLGRLAAACLANQNLEGAINRLEDRFKLARALQDRWAEADALIQLGRAMSDFRQGGAIDHLVQGLEVMRLIGDRAGEAAALEALARAHLARNDHDMAIAALEEERSILRALDEGEEEMETLARLLTVTRMAGQSERVLDLLRQRCDLAVRLQDPQVELMARGEWAEELWQLQRRQSAIEVVKEALHRTKTARLPAAESLRCTLAAWQREPDQANQLTGG